MHKLLLLLPDLHYTGTAQRVRLLADGLRHQGFLPQVCALRASGPVAEQLRARGINCAALGWQRGLDGPAFLQLRQLLHTFQPDTIHAWGTPCLRVALLASVRSGLRSRPRLIASSTLPQRNAGAWMTRLHRWLLDQTAALTAQSSWEREQYQRLGVSATKIVQAGLGVALEPAAAVHSSDGIPEHGRFILCVGPVEPHKGFRTAIWALDILRYLHRDLHLVIVGHGRDRTPLQEFARSIAVDQYVHFVGPQENVAGWLHAADVVWVPTHTSGGTQVALEAMAAGRSVVASRVPDLAEVVADGVSGALVPPEEPVALARQTRLLLDDGARRQQFGEAGEARVRQLFTPAHLVQRFAEVYNAPAA